MKLSKDYFAHYTNEQVLHLYKLLEAVRHNSENDLSFNTLECYLMNTEGYRERNRAPGFLSKVSAWCIVEAVSTSVLKGIPLLNAYNEKKARFHAGTFRHIFGDFTLTQFVKENRLTATETSYMTLATRWEFFNAMKEEAEGRAFDPWDFSPYPKSYTLELLEPYNTPEKRKLLSKKFTKKRTTNQKEKTTMMFEDATPKTSAWPAPIQENPPLAQETPAVTEKPAVDEVKFDVYIKGQKITLTIDPVAYLHDLMGVPL